MMKIIFLDVDGVLNHGSCPEWVNGSPFVLAEECIETLRDVLYLTEAKIVLSSTWRLSDEGRKVVDDALIPGSVIGKTTRLHFSGGPRRDEILHWLESVWPYSLGWNGEVITHMAVLDDDTDADLGDGSFFRTSFEGGGLTKAIADRVITHLGG